MSNPGFASVRRLAGRYDLARHSKFPSARACRRRDRRLKALIEETARKCNDPVQHERLVALATLLSYADRGEPEPASRASALTHNRERLPFGSHLHRKVDQAQRRGEVVTFSTMAFRGGALAPDQVLSADVLAWKKQLQTDLDRVRKRLKLRGPGWSVHFLDCDYLQHEGVFLFHWHGFATGSELEALDGLRRLRKYRSPRQKEGQRRDLVRHRIVLTRKPLYDIGYLVQYVTKDEWPSQPSARNVPGNRGRSY